MPWARHASLAVNTAATVTVPADTAFNGVEIINHSDTVRIYLTSGATTPAVPAVIGNDTDVVVPRSALMIPANGRQVVIRLIASAVADYSVTAQS